jgi:hypothetical protein
VFGQHAVNCTPVLGLGPACLATGSRHAEDPQPDCAFAKGLSVLPEPLGWDNGRGWYVVPRESPTLRANGTPLALGVAKKLTEIWRIEQRLRRQNNHK